MNINARRFCTIVPYSPTTIAFFNLIIHTIFLILFFTLWLRHRQQISGIGFFSANLLLHCIGRAMQIIPVLASLPLSTTLGNTATSLGALFFLFGLASFTGTPIRRRFFILVFGVLAMLDLGFNLMGATPLALSILYGLVSMTYAVFYLRLLIPIRQDEPFFFRPINALIVLYVIFLALFLIRMLFDLRALANGESLIGLDSLQLRLSRLFALMLLTSVDFSTFILINNKLLADMARENAETSRMLGHLRILAERDGLTGLPNRNALERELDALLATAGPENRILVDWIDIDRFKLVNDTLGHEAGDEVLVQLADLFTGTLRHGDFIGRWGGDEFLLMCRVHDVDHAQAIVNRLQEAVRSYDWASLLGDDLCSVSISSGHVVVDHPVARRTLLAQADEHLYRAKNLGRNQSAGA